MKSHKKRTFHIQHKALLAGLFLCLGFVPCLTACTRTPADILVESVPESAPAVSEADSGLPYETTNHTAGETTKESSGELTLEITTSASEPAPDSLESLLNSMTLEEKVGQMFIAAIRKQIPFRPSRTTIWAVIFYLPGILRKKRNRM